MNSIIIEETKKTPAINFDYKTGILEVKGKSIPKDAYEFYNPLLKWLENYAIKPKAFTVCNIKLEYFNTTSSKLILDILKKLEIISLTESKVVVNWLYEQDDEDMIEAGEDYQCIIDLPFNITEIK